ncbi:hypothetical protein TWF703_004657 [Orbilia oligospora]|uniref:Uncharacterized protein n=1 Tax=Orbilia oligospora TaxID=2813651 RepID=A0A7C8NLC3_ORBOL|nr:hypothetical protein TWF703_004657 [Orbilia oligospora]
MAPTSIAGVAVAAIVVEGLQSATATGDEDYSDDGDDGGDGDAIFDNDKRAGDLPSAYRKRTKIVYPESPPEFPALEPSEYSKSQALHLPSSPTGKTISRTVIMATTSPDLAPILQALATMQGHADRAQKYQANEYLEAFQKSVGPFAQPLLCSTTPSRPVQTKSRRAILIIVEVTPPAVRAVHVSWLNTLLVPLLFLKHPSRFLLPQVDTFTSPVWEKEPVVPQAILEHLSWFICVNQISGRATDIQLITTPTTATMKIGD